MLGVALVLFVLSFSNIFTNQEAIDARDTLAFCEFASQLSSECGDAQLRWDDAIGYAWSLSALGLALGIGTFVVVVRPLEDGTWPTPEQQGISRNEGKAIESTGTHAPGSSDATSSEEE